MYKVFINIFYNKTKDMSYSLFIFLKLYEKSFFSFSRFQNMN